ncbi:C25 family cysteine peptidase [Myxococcota bacterium]|nr:C25 family cysteine peptidase [Myxococcota bacterium]
MGLCLLPVVSSAADYAIVISTEIRNLSQSLAAFADSKAARGYTVHIYDETDWNGGGLTDDAAAESLRSFLQSAHALHGLDYVLLIGDPRPQTGPIPMKRLYPRTFGYQSTSPNGWSANCDTFVMTQDPVPSDYYYGDMDGNWDLDGDGLYGEFGDHDAPTGPTGDFGPGGVDRNHEFPVGRIPVYSANPTQLSQGVANLDHILNKTMTYQAAPFGTTDWRSSALIAAEGANRIFFGEALRDDVFTPANFSPVSRVYDAEVCLVPNPPSGCVSISGIPEATTCTVANVFTQWNNASPGAVTWLTHGGGAGAAGVMTNTQAAQLDDDYPVITFQASCFNSQPSQTNNLSYALLKNGAVGAIGATGISHGPGSSNPPITHPSSEGGNAGMAYYFMQHLVQSGMTVGDSLSEVKRESDLYGRCWYWQNMAGFNLYGDPEVSLYDSGPQVTAVPTLAVYGRILLLGALGAIGSMTTLRETKARKTHGI